MAKEKQIDLKQRDIDCADRARKRGQQTFTIVAQDKSNAKVIAFWIAENIETSPEEKLRTALEIALQMRKNPRKNPD
jgi:hypothetical protein